MNDNNNGNHNMITDMTESLEKKDLEKTLSGKNSKRIFKNYFINSFIVYTITNLENNRYYIGYSDSGEERKESHSSRLASGVHPVTDLQNDYNSIQNRGLDVDKYIVFDVKKVKHICGTLDPKEVEEISRNFYDLEQTLILEAFAKDHNLYNRNPNKISQATLEKNKAKTYSAPSSIPCKINGVSYSSLTKAAKDQNISTRSVKHRLDSSKYPEYEYDISNKKKSQKARVARGVRWKEKIFASISACRKETKLHYDVVSSSCNDPLNKDFEWISEKDVKKKLSNTAVRVSIDGQIFPSYNAAVKHLKTRNIHTSIRKLKKQCQNSDFPNYKFVD